MVDINAAFAAIRERRDELNTIDDQLSGVIRHVEVALRELQPGVSTDVDYEVTDEGTHWLSFQKHNGTWQIMWSNKDDGWHTPLVSASRQVRAEIFNLLPAGLTPLELLIHEMASSIAEYAAERSGQLERAKKLSAALVAAGIPRPVE